MFNRFVALIGIWRELTCALLSLSTYGFCLLLEIFWQHASLWFYLLANGLCLIGLYPLCWKAPHPWPVWATGCALLAVMADILALSHAQVLRLTLVWVINLTGCVLMISLAIGVYAVWKSRKHLNKSEKLGIFSYD